MSDHAFLIGANHERLGYAADGIRRLNDTLNTLGFVTTIVVNDATAGCVLLQLKSILNGLLPEDQFFFYFVGYGLAKYTTVQLILPTTDTNSLFTYLNCEDIINSIASARCRSRLIILDCPASVNLNKRAFKDISNFTLITISRSQNDLNNSTSISFGNLFCQSLNLLSGSNARKTTVDLVIKQIKGSLSSQNAEHVNLNISVNVGNNNDHFAFTP
jgi:hypothetical protein